MINVVELRKFWPFVGWHYCVSVIIPNFFFFLNPRRKGRNFIGQKHFVRFDKNKMCLSTCDSIDRGYISFGLWFTWRWFTIETATVLLILISTLFPSGINIWENFFLFLWLYERSSAFLPPLILVPTCNTRQQKLDERERDRERDGRKIKRAREARSTRRRWRV